jgi:TonB family protein
VKLNIRACSIALLTLVTMSYAHTKAPGQMPCVNLVHTGTASLYYPPIARAAHVDGNVILLVAFAHDGSVSNVKAVSGSQLLQGSALAYIKAWKADPSEGSRECPVVISYKTVGPPSAECGTKEAADRAAFPQPPIERSDPLHVTLFTRNLCFSTQAEAAANPLHPFLLLHRDNRA